VPHACVRRTFSCAEKRDRITGLLIRREQTPDERSLLAQVYEKATKKFPTQAPCVQLAHPKLLNARQRSGASHTKGPPDQKNFAAIQVK